MDADSKTTTTANGTARRVTSNKDNDDKPASQTQKTTAQTQTQTQTAKTPETKQPAPKQEEEFLGQDDDAITSTKSQRASTPSNAASQKDSQPAKASTPAKSSGGNKTARIRYPVPPVGRPMSLRIEVTDPAGKRNIMNRQVRGGETINATANYSQECLITIYLDGQLVWQERKD